MKDNNFTRPPIWSLPKRDGMIYAAEREFQGSKFFELRFWADGGTQPTKQGVTFPPDKVPELARALADYCASFATP